MTKYIDRKSKDQIIKKHQKALGLSGIKGYSNNYLTFANDGWSKKQNFYIRNKTIDDFNILGV